MIPAAPVSLVSRNVAMGGPTEAAIRAIVGSSITPGPLGIAPTSPSASAPCAIARRASSGEAMQQILIRVRRMPQRSSRSGRKMLANHDRRA
jgi:hypothetical protein